MQHSCSFAAPSLPLPSLFVILFYSSSRLTVAFMCILLLAAYYVFRRRVIYWIPTVVLTNDDYWKKKKFVIWFISFFMWFCLFSLIPFSHTRHSEKRYHCNAFTILISCSDEIDSLKNASTNVSWRMWCTWALIFNTSTFWRRLFCVLSSLLISAISALITAGFIHSRKCNTLRANSMNSSLVCIKSITVCVIWSVGLSSSDFNEQNFFHFPRLVCVLCLSLISSYHSFGMILVNSVHFFFHSPIFRSKLPDLLSR